MLSSVKKKCVHLHISPSYFKIMLQIENPLPRLPGTASIVVIPGLVFTNYKLNIYYKYYKRKSL